MDEPRSFEELQAGMRAIWPTVTLRSIGEVERTTVVVHSMGPEIPRQLVPVFPAYEERFLCLVLSLLRSPRSHVVYVTSQPIMPRLVDYFFGLVPGFDTPEARGRLTIVSLVDGSDRPLTEKLLERPGAIERIRRAVLKPELALIVPFSTSPHEVELAVRLGLPLYGADPALSYLGTKRGARKVFADEGVPHPHGYEVTGTSELEEAILRIRRERPGADSVIVKLDQGVSGLGNAVVDVAGADGGDEVRRRIRDLVLENPEQEPDAYLEALDEQGGIVEERIRGAEFRSPSAQLRLSPAGLVEVLSTHDQVLGGPQGQTYFGCRFPADPEYAERIGAEALAVGRRLAREGVIGRCAVDFVAVRGDDGAWHPYALEINLRCGGTTHPFFALTALTDGLYDPATGEFRSGTGSRKHYVATDHLERPEYARLIPDDLLDVVAERDIGWDREREVGAVLHMVSALAVAGMVGVTAIGDTPEEARSHYYRVQEALDVVGGGWARLMGRGRPARASCG